MATRESSFLVNLQVQTGHALVCGYQFETVPAVKPGAMLGSVPANEAGYKHAGEIEYVFGTLKWQDVPWTPEDFRLSETMSTYWTNFAKNGNPNETRLPDWPRYESSNKYQVMHLSARASHSMPEMHRERYELLDAEATGRIKLPHNPGTE